MAGGKVETILSEWLVVALIIFSLILEFLLHRLEHWIQHKHQHLQAVTKVLYRELMILGFVSFLFVAANSIFKFRDNQFLSFEFAHYFIFFMAITHTFIVMCTMFSSLRLSARWKRMEQVDLVSYLHLKDQYTRIRLRIHKHQGPLWRRLRWWFPNFGLLFKYRNLHEMMAFHDIRFQFIFYRNLPEHFRFSSFLRKIKALTFLELVELHWSLYAIFLAVVLADIVRRIATGQNKEPAASVSKYLVNQILRVPKTKPPPTDIVESILIVAASIFIAFVSQVLAMKIKRIYWQLTKHPRVYYEGVNAAVVEEEISAAQSRREEERRLRKLSKTSTELENGEVADDESLDYLTNRTSMETAETEMLAPMNPAPLSRSRIRTGVPDPETASPIIDNAIRINDGKKQLEVVTSTYNGTRVSNDEIQPKDEVSVRSSDEVQPRHSVDLSTMNRPLAMKDPRNRRRVHSTMEETRRTFKPFSPEDAQMQEVSVRHSLEHTKLRQVGSSEALVALEAIAAVETAQKHSLESALQRHSMELSRKDDTGRPYLGSPRILSQLSGRALSEDEGLGSASEMIRHSIDSRGRASARPSIELARAMPHGEILKRHHERHRSSLEHTSLDMENIYDSQRYVTEEYDDGPESGNDKSKIRFAVTNSNKPLPMGDPMDGTSGLRNQNSLLKHKSLSFLNPTLLKHLEIQQDAQRQQPEPYPAWLVSLIPRLGRVASPVEKLFWFGSHKFFLFCLEFTLFFATVLFAAAFASLAIILIAGQEITNWNIASFVLPPLTLLFCLFRVAGIMKKYIFIIHNASLVPEALAIETIHKISKKKPVYSIDDVSDDSGSENERENAEPARERRRKLGRFFRSEAAEGNVMGISASEGRRSSQSSTVSKKVEKRRLALRLRRRRAENAENFKDPDVSYVPDSESEMEAPGDSLASFEKPSQNSVPGEVV